VLTSVVEAAGYACRAVSASESPDWTFVPYVVQTFAFLLGPSLITASIYMILSKIIIALDADIYSLVPVKVIPKVFIFGDVVALAAQFTGNSGSSRLDRILIRNRCWHLDQCHFSQSAKNSSTDHHWRPGFSDLLFRLLHIGLAYRAQPHDRQPISPEYQSAHPLETLDYRSLHRLRTCNRSISLSSGRVCHWTPWHSPSNRNLLLRL
jgi:hypothetical protein